MLSDINISALELIVLALAVFRITRLLIEDEIFDTPRDWLYAKFRGKPLLTYLLTCYWCLSMYVAVVVVGLYLLIPIPTLIVCVVLALSAVVGLIDKWKTNG